jgi:hypothetical protein
MHISKLAFLGLFGLITACVSPALPQEQDTEQSVTEAPAGLDETSSPVATQLKQAPAAACGWTCLDTGIIEQPLNHCLLTCPGGAASCVPTGPVCP